MLENPTIAIFVPSMRGGGTERMMLNLAVGMVDAGVRVDLVLAQAEGDYMAQIPGSVNLVDLKAKRILSSLPPLVMYLRHRQPHAMLSAMSHTNLVALWAKQFARTSTRIVVSERTTVSQDVRLNLVRRSRLIPPLIRLSYQWADGIIAVSQGVAEDLAHLTSAPITVIHNPVVTPHLLALAHQSPDHPWLMDKKHERAIPVILAVGRLTVAKDFPTLIRAVAKIREQRRVRLLILGEGEDRAALESLVQNLDLQSDVLLPGFVNNPYAYMHHADVFVLSSMYEGFPNVLVEAMACGCPVVSTDCRSGPTEILQHGAFGRLVTPGDIDGVAQAVLTTLDSPPDAEILRQRAGTFSLSAVVEHYLRVLN